MRALHTVKGAARMLEFNQIEGLSHALESVFLSLKEERISLNDKAVKLILSSIDELKRGINKVKSGGKDNIQAEAFQKELICLSANEDYEIPSGEDTQKAHA
jgi:chemotaxis protein histidine kinase CheA